MSIFTNISQSMITLPIPLLLHYKHLLPLKCKAVVQYLLLFYSPVKQFSVIVLFLYLTKCCLDDMSPA